MIFEIDGITQGYDKNVVIEDISMSAESGEVVTILGPNGSGKSTLIKTICNIMDPWAGTISIDGTPIKEMDRKEFAKIVGYVPQKATFFGRSTVYDSVLIGRIPYMKWSYSKEDINVAADAMMKMKIDSLYDRDVSELSGGQAQRVTLARTLAQDPVFYIFDEPTSALDLKNQLDTLRIMRDIIKNKGACMIMAMHDLNLALRYSDKVAAIKDGRIYGFGPTEEIITRKMVRDVYDVDSEIVETSRGRYIHAFYEDLEEDEEIKESA